MVIGNPLAAIILIGLYSFVFGGIIIYFIMVIDNPLCLFVFIGCFSLFVKLLLYYDNWRRKP